MAGQKAGPAQLEALPRKERHTPAAPVSHRPLLCCQAGCTARLKGLGPRHLLCRVWHARTACTACTCASAACLPPASCCTARMPGPWRSHILNVAGIWLWTCVPLLLLLLLHYELEPGHEQLQGQACKHCSDQGSMM